MKILADSLVIKGQTFESASKDKFLKNLHKQKPRNVWHPVTDEIINGNYKNIENKVRTSVVLKFERKLKVVNDFA